MALLIKANGTVQEVKPAGEDGRLTYDQIRECIGGGWIEHVETDPERARGNSHVYCDEEGKLKNLPENMVATLMSAYTMPGDVLCGDVLFCTAEEDMG